MRRYSFEELERLHNENGYEHTFNRDYKGKTFIKKTIKMDQVVQISIIKQESLVHLPKDKIKIDALIEAYNVNKTIPSVILKVLKDGRYDIIDGVHRLSSMNILDITEFEAFVLE